MDEQKKLKEIFHLVSQAGRVFVQGHANCGDAAGSTLAMMHWLESIDKPYLAFSPEPIPDMFSFLPGVGKIVSDPKRFHMSDFDVLLILDCGDVERTGIAQKIKAEKQSTATVVNIDHHHTNDNFGDINFVDKQAPATASLIHEFMEANHITINKQIATCLLNGIFTDTGIFTNPATNQAALAKAAELLTAGARLGTILRSILKNKTVSGLRLWGRALQRLTLNEEYGIAHTVLLQEDFRDMGGVSSEAVEGLANFMNNLQEARITMILREEVGGVIKGSFRTTDDRYDVGRLAASLGGGGHKKAAGFTIKGSLHYDEHKQRWEII